MGLDIGLETDFHFLLAYLFIPSLSAALSSGFCSNLARKTRGGSGIQPPVCSPAEAPSEGVGFITRAGKSRAEQNKEEDFIRASPSYLLLTSLPGTAGVFFFSSGQSEWIMKMSAGSVPLILTYFMIMKGDQRMIMIGKAAADAAGCSARGLGEEEGAASGRMAG